MIAVRKGFGEFEEVSQKDKSVKTMSGMDVGPAGHAKGHLQ